MKETNINFSNFSNQLKEMREEMNLSQEEAAEKIGISRCFLSELESGKKKPSFNTLMKLIDFYGKEVILDLAS